MRDFSFKENLFSLVRYNGIFSNYLWKGSMNDTVINFLLYRNFSCNLSIILKLKPHLKNFVIMVCGRFFLSKIVIAIMLRL